MDNINLHKGICTCGKPGTKKCSGCSVARYCSVECQRENWPKHKKVCSKYTDESKKNLSMLHKLHPSLITVIVADHFNAKRISFEDYDGVVFKVINSEIFESHHNYNDYVQIIPSSKSDLASILQKCSRDIINGRCRRRLL